MFMEEDEKYLEGWAQDYMGYSLVFLVVYMIGKKQSSKSNSMIILG